MTRDTRRPLQESIQALRGGRALVCVLTLDKGSQPHISGLSTQFAPDVKEPLFRVLKESEIGERGVDLFIYTRGGDANAVWPVVSLLREFDQKFEVLVPFRCHSAGTLLSLGARRIVMGPISELSPIDPTTANQFNPVDPNNPQARLGIGVEDVRSYMAFVSKALRLSERKEVEPGKDSDLDDTARSLLAEFAHDLTKVVHPLAIGNVHRATDQIRRLAKDLLQLNPCQRDIDGIIESLTSEFKSHQHMICRTDAEAILGDRIVNADAQLSKAMDELWGSYKKDFKTWQNFYLASHMGDKPSVDARFIGALVESPHAAPAASYVFETQAKAYQQSAIPPNVQIQIPVGQGMPIVPGLPRSYRVEVVSQGWARNAKPREVTL